MYSTKQISAQQNQKRDSKFMMKNMLSFETLNYIGNNIKQHYRYIQTTNDSANDILHGTTYTSTRSTLTPQGSVASSNVTFGKDIAT